MQCSQIRNIVAQWLGQMLVGCTRVGPHRITADHRHLDGAQERVHR